MEPETLQEKYVRETRNAAVFIAWAIGIGVLAGLVLSIVTAVELGNLLSAVTQPSI